MQRCKVSNSYQLSNSFGIGDDIIEIHEYIKMSSEYDMNPEIKCPLSKTYFSLL